MQTGAQRGVGRRTSKQASGQSAQIVTGADNNEDAFAAPQDILNRILSEGAETCTVELLIRIDDIEQVMKDCHPLGLGRFSRANIEIPVDLARVSADNLRSVTYGQIDGEGSF